MFLYPICQGKNAVPVIFLRLGGACETYSQLQDGSPCPGVQFLEALTDFRPMVGRYGSDHPAIRYATFIVLGSYDAAEDQESSDAWVPAVKNWLRVHLFRTGTAVLTLALLGLCFFYSPDVLTVWLRATMKIIETVAGLLPYPWGDRVEIAMKALGGSFWFLVTSAIIMVRVVFWLVAAGWRRRPSRRGPKADGGEFRDARSDWKKQFRGHNT